MRALVLCAGLVLGCRSAPAWEPIGGFELVARPTGDWCELPAREFEQRLVDARVKVGALPAYTAVLETRERIEDDLYPRRVMRLRVRHAPFSVAVVSELPENETGQRAWYDASWNRGEMVAQTNGWLGKLVGRTSLDPEGEIALDNRRHPITDIGLLRLVEQVEESLAAELARARPPRFRATELSLGERRATLVEALVAREPPDAALVHRFAFDEESGFLVYYGLAELLPDGPALVEEYLYRDVDAAPELGDADFRPES